LRALREIFHSLFDGHFVLVVIPVRFRACVLILCYTATTGKAPVPIFVTQAADYHALRTGRMNEIAIRQIYAHMGNTYAVYPEENKITFIGVV
jgi:hypothetical protein